MHVKYQLGLSDIYIYTPAVPLLLPACTNVLHAMIR